MTVPAPSKNVAHWHYIFCIKMERLMLLRIKIILTISVLSSAVVLFNVIPYKIDTAHNATFQISLKCCEFVN
jgi:hypothetical protein